jgi:hypothetical protein
VVVALCYHLKEIVMEAYTAVGKDLYRRQAGRPAHDIMPCSTVVRGGGTQGGRPDGVCVCVLGVCV